MEALERKTIDDLLHEPDERVELIDGEIVRRPMARSEHGIVQGNTVTELGTYSRAAGPSGCWIITEVSVSYELRQCPSHDIAGWRKERMPQRPRSVIDARPDWVCEIVSPGHERKDTLKIFLLLQRHRVPFYWLIWPEDRTLIAYRLEGSGYGVIKTITGESIAEQPRARIPPFDDVELDLVYVLGESG